MAIIGYPETLLALVCCFLVLCCYWIWCINRCRRSLLTNWPILGMLPGLLRNANHIHDFVTEILNESGGTFEFKGPWFSNMDMLVTSDPVNVHHILSKYFSNYPKGQEFNKIFDILGDGIFNADSELWEIHRKTTMSLINHPDFFNFLQRTSWNKVGNGLIPILDHASELGIEIDLQELFQRFTFDSICILLLGKDPGSLSSALPHIPCEKAFSDIEIALLFRHVLPESCWKLQKWLQIGQEKKLSMAWVAFDQFIYQYVNSQKHDDEQLISKSCRSYDQMVDDKEEEAQEGVSDHELLPAYLEAFKGKSTKFLRDTLLSLMFAGRGTTSSALTWFFWLLSINPLAETKILEELKTKFMRPIRKEEEEEEEEDEDLRLFSAEESRKLVYLHGALCEALRLFPPVPLEHKAPIEADILPSGHQIDRNTKTVLSFYSMGRMESIWGKDCLEFKPERWISERGGIKHEPSYKFPAFNAGPRSCLGKEMSFVQMKIVVAAIIYNYHIQVVKDHPISPSDSVILSMKHGFKVRVTKKSI